MVMFFWTARWTLPLLAPVLGAFVGPFTCMDSAVPCQTRRLEDLLDLCSLQKMSNEGSNLHLRRTSRNLRECTCEASRPCAYGCGLSEHSAG